MSRIGLTTLVLLLAGCSATVDSNQGGGTIGVVDGIVELSAIDTRFDASVIMADAGEPFLIDFTNRENVPHNVSVYPRAGGAAIAIGDIIDVAGRRTRVAVPALEDGAYLFVCDAHPQVMSGMLVVGTPP